MKKTFLVLATFMLCVGLAAAQEIETNMPTNNTGDNGLIITTVSEESTPVSEDTAEEAEAFVEEEIAEPATTPESPFYDLRNAFSEIGMFFTFNTEKKVEKRLEKAGQKLLEVNKMLEKENLKAAEQAKKNYLKEIEKAKASIAKLGQKQAKAQLKTAIAFQNRIENQEELLEKIEDNLEIRIQKLKALPEEQQQTADELVASLKEKREVIAERVKEKREQAEADFKEDVGEEVFDEKVGEIEEETGLKEAREERIIKAVAITGKKLVRAKIALKNLTNTEELKQQIREAKQLTIRLINETDYGEVQKQREEINNFGQNISVLAKSLRIAKQEGTFEEAHARLVNAAKTRSARVIQEVKTNMENREKEREKIKTEAVKTVTQRATATVGAGGGTGTTATTQTTSSGNGAGVTTAASGGGGGRAGGGST